MARLHRIAVYLPAGEDFSPVTGGALATWTHKVYARLQDHFDVQVVCRNCEAPYPCPQRITVQPNPIAARAAAVLRNRSCRGLLEPSKQFLRRQPARRAAQIVSRRPPDLVHIHNDPEAVLPIRAHNRKAAIILHMNNDHLIRGQAAEDGTAEAAVAASDSVAFCSQYARDAALRKLPGLDLSKCFVIPNGADVPEVGADRYADRPKRAAGPIILFVGRIVPEKGLDLLVAAMPSILAAHPTALLRVVGGVTFGSHHTDGYLAAVRSSAAALGDRVEFSGPVPQHEVANYLAGADVFVCPSVWDEPFGMVNVEAMAAGAPVVAFAKGGIPEAVGDAGVLVPECSVEDLAQGVCRLLSDQALRVGCTRMGRERVARQFSWDVVAKQWREQVEQLLEGRFAV